MERKKFNRRSIRLRGYDYSQEGGYYVTLCTHGRACIFGEIHDETMVLNELGTLVQDEWKRTPQIRPEVEIDDFVVMPNHLHGIIFIRSSVGAYRNTPQRDTTHFLRSPSHTLGAIIRGFKSSTTTQINTARSTPSMPVWQRNYYEHIVRDLDDLNRIRDYIRNNVIAWQADEENPTNTMMREE